MGGFAGHMSHIYENPSLTFKEIKDILTKASSGQLIGTEKTDGINIFISYSIKDRNARAARNKSDIVNGGMTLEQLSDKFSGRGSLYDAFVESFNAFDNLIDSISVEDQIEIFGPDANFFYNAEIQDPRASNVITYDNKTLTFHRTGHVEVNKMTGDVQKSDFSERFKKLEDILNNHSSDIFVDFSIKTNSQRNIPGLQNEEALNVAISRIHKLMNNNGLKDSNTIGDFIVLGLKTKLNDFNIPDFIKSDVIARIVGTPGVSLTSINKSLSKNNSHLMNIVRDVVKNSNSILKDVIFPLEDIIHDFSVEFLKGLESSFVSNNGAEVDRIKKVVSNAIKAIENSGNNEAMQVLQSQMKKIKDLENISSAAEGFVFDYNGKTYKMTGNFAPINQILGLFKYGRGNIPPLEMVSESEITKKSNIALFPGKFKPPHAGHFSVATNMLQKAERVLVLISSKEVDGIDSSKSKQIWDIYIKSANLEGLIYPMIISGSPIRAVYDYIDAANKGETIALVLGEKDIEDGRFKTAEQRRPDVKITHFPIPPQAGGIDATKVRNYILNGDYDNFVKVLPSAVSTEDKKRIWNILKNNMNEVFFSLFNEVLKESNLHLINKDGIMEIAAMAAGSVVGTSEPEELEEDLPMFVSGGTYKRDDNMIDRNEFLNELKLRKVIRNMLKENKVAFKSHSEQLSEEMKLRAYIRKFISESSEVVPHESTGINVLEDLLKKIMPVIELDYKDLTTDPEQRKSYRAHILNAVQNSLAPSMAMDEPPASPETDNMVAEQSEMSIDVDPSKDEKFIDIDGDGIPDSEEEEKKEFSIPGEDETGRNVSLMTFQKIEKNIIDSYKVLSNDKDRKLFYDYLITNLKLYFDKYEDEMSNIVIEPNSDIYNREKEQLGSNSLDSMDSNSNSSELDLSKE